MADILQWAVMAVITLLLGYLAWRKNPQERQSLNGGTLRSYAEAARLAGEGLQKANLHIQELEKAQIQSTLEFERRLDFLETGAAYEVKFNFKIGEHPMVENVIITPLVLSGTPGN